MIGEFKLFAFKLVIDRWEQSRHFVVFCFVFFFSFLLFLSFSLCLPLELGVCFYFVCVSIFFCLFVCDGVLLLISVYLLAFPCSYHEAYIKLLTIITVYFKLITSYFQWHTNYVYKVFYIFSSSILYCWSHSLHLLKLCIH